MPILYNRETVQEIIDTNGDSVKKYKGLAHGKIMHKMLPFVIGGKNQNISIGSALAKSRQGQTVVVSKSVSAAPRVILEISDNILETPKIEKIEEDEETPKIEKIEDEEETLETVLEEHEAEEADEIPEIILETEEVEKPKEAVSLNKFKKR